MADNVWLCHHYRMRYLRLKHLKSNQTNLNLRTCSLWIRWFCILWLLLALVDYCSSSPLSSKLINNKTTSSTKITKTLNTVTNSLFLSSSSSSLINNRSQNFTGHRNRLIDLSKTNNKSDNNNPSKDNDSTAADNDDERNYYLTIDDDQLRTPLTSSLAPPPSSSPSSNSSTIFFCPEKFGYFADKEDCSRYYVCVFGDPLHETCTGGLYFSSELQTCDWPQNVDCTATIITITTTTGQQSDHYNGQNDIIHFNNEKMFELNKTMINEENRFNNKNNNNNKSKSEEKENIDVESGSTEQTSIDFDYNNDLDNPDFDESIASFVDTNGEIYVHDSPTGLYSLLERSNAISDHEKSLYHENTKAKGGDGKVNLIQHNKKKKINNHVNPIKITNNNYETITKSQQNKTITYMNNKNVKFDDDDYGNVEDGDEDDNSDGYNENDRENKNIDFERDIGGEEDGWNDSRILPYSGQQEEHHKQQEQQRQQPYPEHLLPRLKIVKKQLKDFEAETPSKIQHYNHNHQRDNNNNIKEKEMDKHDHHDNHDKNIEKEQQKPKISKQHSFIYKNIVHEDSSMNAHPETITFVADTNNDDYLNKRDLWNYEINTKSSQLTTTNQKPSRLATLFDSFDMNKVLKFDSPRRSKVDLNHSSLSHDHNNHLNKQRGLNSFSGYDKYLFQPRMKPLLNHDSIFQVFQGYNPKYQNNTSANNRIYLLQSLSLPIYSYPSTDYTSQFAQNKPEKSSIRIATSSAETNFPQTVRSTPKENKNSQIIFYSYRDQMNPKNLEKLNRSPSSNLLNHSSSSSSSLIDVPSLNNRPKTMLEVFTIRSEDFLLKNNNSMQASQINEKRIKPIRNVTMMDAHESYRRLYRLDNAKLNKTPIFQLNLFPSLLSNKSTNEALIMMKTTTIQPPVEKPIMITSSNYSIVKESINYVIQSNDNSQHQQCDPKLNCRLPKCFCPGVKAPYGFKRKEIPQMILLTFDDAVNDVNFPLYQEIFDHHKPSRTNPNGCPIKATFFVSHEWTDYGKVQTLYSKGHEIASHSITHSYGEKFSIKDWYREIAGQREILHRFAGIPRNEIRGMRAPFLQIGGDEQFQMLMDSNMTYDSSISIFDNAPPYWPYTLDFGIQHDCMITPCPTRSYPGIWEIGLIMWHDLMGGGRCTMGNSCTSPSDEKGVFELIMTNFKRHYDTNRAPFGLFYQSNWFTMAHHKAGFLRFIDEVLRLNDVYFVTNWQLLRWIQNPINLDRIDQFEPWQCRNVYKKPECLVPNICHVKFQKGEKIGSRFFKTCQRCPTDYPWINNIDQLMATN